MKRLKPKPQAPENGTYIVDAVTGEEVFVLFDDLKRMCKEVMAIPKHLSDAVAGKPHWQDDPTYDAPRKKPRGKV